MLAVHLIPRTFTAHCAGRARTGPRSLVLDLAGKISWVDGLRWPMACVDSSDSISVSRTQVVANLHAFSPDWNPSGALLVLQSSGPRAKSLPQASDVLLALPIISGGFCSTRYSIWRPPGPDQGRTLAQFTGMFDCPWFELLEKRQAGDDRAESAAGTSSVCGDVGVTAFEWPSQSQTRVPSGCCKVTCTRVVNLPKERSK